MAVLARIRSFRRNADHCVSRLTCVCVVLAAVLALIAMGDSPVSGASEAPPTEYEVKAAFIFKFISFVEWPDESFPEDDTPIRIGILGEDPFGKALDRTIEGKMVRSRKLEVKRSKDVEDLTACHIVFVARSVSADTQSLTTKLHQQHVLTIGDSTDFAKRGGIINFIEREGKIRFEINAQSAQRANIRISSQLMSLANVVKPDDEEGNRDKAPA